VQRMFELNITASGYEQKALVAQPIRLRVPVLYPESSPGGQDTMAQFLQIPAVENLSLHYGFVQSRNYKVGRWVMGFVSR